MKKTSWEIPPITPIASFRFYFQSGNPPSHENENEAIGILGGFPKIFSSMHRAYNNPLETQPTEPSIHTIHRL